MPLPPQFTLLALAALPSVLAEVATATFLVLIALPPVLAEITPSTLLTVSALPSMLTQHGLGMRC